MSTVLIRCDGSSDIGLGHVIRCCSLAKALQKLNHSVIFVMNPRSAQSAEWLTTHGFQVAYIPNAADITKGVELNDADQDFTVALAHKTESAIILVDHYGASSNYLAGLSNRGFKVGVIDDLGDRAFHTVDWILNQNLGALRIEYHIKNACIKLFGPAFALLRPEFAEVRKQVSRTFDAEDRNVLLTLGGGDVSAKLTQIIKAISKSSVHLRIRCIVSALIRFTDELRDAMNASPHDIQFLQNVENVPDHMAWADCSINAGGGTCWELCCMGVPMILMVFSEDQQRNADLLEQEGCAVNLHHWDDHTSPQRLSQTLEHLFHSPSRRKTMSNRAWQLVDGAGAERAADSFEELIHES